MGLYPNHERPVVEDVGTVKYRITKECGVGWDEPQPTGPSTWGASERQRRLAEKVAPGDIFLHFIDSAHAWAGYSTVTGKLQKNDRDSDEDWAAALPFVIPIEPNVWLKRDQCEQTVSLPGLSSQHYHRRRAFSAVHPEDARVIIRSIDAAAEIVSTPSDDFYRRWMKGAENYYKGIVKGLVAGKCLRCGESVDSWLVRNGFSIPTEVVESIRDSFLDAAHIIPDAERGTMTPDNLRALCPNCHRIFDRLPMEYREAFLQASPGQGKHK